MSIIDTATSFLNPVMHPLVSIHPFLAVCIVSFVIALFNAWIYKRFTDQHKMKALKEDMRRMQDDIKKYKDNANKMMEIQGRLMQKNLEYMKSSFKPTLITMIPILLILGWMTANLAYEPIHPDVPVNVTLFLDKAVAGDVTLEVPFGITLSSPATQTIGPDHAIAWELQGKAGDYKLTFAKGDEEVSQPIIISDEQRYAKPMMNYDSEIFLRSKIHNESKRVLDLGFFSLGYLLTYIITAILFSLGIRKLMKLH